MYPLKVAIVGVNEALLPHVRREMFNENASVEGEYPDVDAAATRLRASREEMRLFIIEVRSALDLQALRRLVSSFVGRPILALVESSPDGRIVLDAMRAGATQVVLVPFQHEDFLMALECIALQFGRVAADTRVIAVSGVSGGCGATTIALNLAYEIAFSQSRHSLLIEMTPKMGVLATYLNIEPRYTTEDLLRLGDRMDVYALKPALIRFADKFDVLTGPYRAITPLEVCKEDVLRLVDYSRRLADIVVLDVPCTYDDRYFAVLGAAHQIVLVGEQKVPSIRAMHMVSETLAREGGIEKQVMVVNRYDAKLQGFTIVELSELLPGVKLLPVANDYPNVMASINQGRPIRLVTSMSPALADIDSLACWLLGIHEQPRPAARSSAIFGKLMRAFHME